MWLKYDEKKNGNERGSLVFVGVGVGGTTIYVDATNGDDTQEGVGTTSDKAYKTVAAAVAAAKSGDTI